MADKNTAAVAVVTKDGYMVGIADRARRGYTPTTLEYSTYEEASACADIINRSVYGLTPIEAAEIALSTMRIGG